MSFPSTSTQYDPAAVDVMIADFESELADERALATTLDETALDQKLADATAFLSANSPLVSVQLTKLQDLNLQLRDIVEQNKRRIAKDKAYNDLINSQPYLDLAAQLLDIKTTAKALHEFLVDAGVRGQPRASSSTKSSSSK
jgi:hypothetical protein